MNCTFRTFFPCPSIAALAARPTGLERGRQAGRWAAVSSRDVIQDSQDASDTRFRASLSSWPNAQPPQDPFPPPSRQGFGHVLASSDVQGASPSIHLTRQLRHAPLEPWVSGFNTLSNVEANLLAPPAGSSLFRPVPELPASGWEFPGSRDLCRWVFCVQRLDSMDLRCSNCPAIGSSGFLPLKTTWPLAVSQFRSFAVSQSHTSLRIGFTKFVSWTNTAFQGAYTRIRHSWHGSLPRRIRSAASFRYGPSTAFRWAFWNGSTTRPGREHLLQSWYTMCCGERCLSWASCSKTGRSMSWFRRRGTADRRWCWLRPPMSPGLIRRTHSPIRWRHCWWPGAWSWYSGSLKTRWVQEGCMAW